MSSNINTGVDPARRRLSIGWSVATVPGALTGDLPARIFR